MNFAQMNIFVGKIIPIVIILFFSSFFVPYVEGEQSTVQLSFTEGHSFNPQISVIGNDVYVVWTDDSIGNKEIFFSKSSDAGLNFEDAKNISNNNGTSAFPRMEIVDDKIFVTWYDYSYGKSEILLSRSFDNGKTFETTVVSNNAGASYNPWIKTDGKNVYVVWNDETPHMLGINVHGPENVDVVLGDLEILIATSHDQGKTFDIYNLSNSEDSVSWDPRIFLSDENVYVVWNETIETGDEIFFSMSSDYGVTFSKPKNISVSNISSTGAGIQVLGDDIYIIWNEAGDIFFSTSDNHGITFSKPKRISLEGQGSGLTRDTQMIVSETDVFVVWFDNDVKNGVFLAKSTDKGITFAPPVKIADFSYSLDAQLASNEDALYVLANYVSDGSHIFLRSSHDGGQTFGSIETLSRDHKETGLSVLGPQIATSDNKVYVVFESKNQDTSDLYLAILDNQDESHEGILLQTPDKTIDVLLDFGNQVPDIEKQTIFDLEFIEHNTGSLLENVRYSFVIIDSEGNTIINNQNQLASKGADIQTVQFPKAGSATIKINVIGANNGQPNVKYAGETSAVVTVVPEFPGGVLIVIVLVTSAVIIQSRFFRINYQNKLLS